MRFWIDIVNPSSGEKMGSGPIYTPLYWEHTARISRAGEVRFAMLANDQRADLIAPKRLAKCYTAVLPSSSAAQVARWGTGIIDSVTLENSADGRSQMSVRGDDLLRELVYRSVGRLKLSAISTALTPAQAIRHNPDSKTNDDLVDDGPITLDDDEYIYVGHTEPFDAWTPEISAGNGTTATLSAQFYSDNEEWNGWQSISIEDGTSEGGVTLSQTGAVSWTRPGPEWVKMRHNDAQLYWMRFRPNTALGSVTFTANYVTGDGPTVTGPADIMAFAPSGWSLDTTGGSDETTKAVKHQFAGETVLAALIRLSELSGEDFRLSGGDNRQITWGPAKPSTGVRAVLGTAATSLLENDAVCVIQNMRRVHETYESFYGRIYAIGADDLTLEGTAATPPSGFSLGSDGTGFYLQHDSTWSAYGIEFWMEFPDVSDADMLYEAAYETLVLRRGKYEVYEVTVVKLETAVLPGETIVVAYQRTTGVFSLQVHEQYTVLEITTRIDPDGIRVTRMKLGSKTAKARYPDSEDEIIGRIL